MSDLVERLRRLVPSDSSGAAFEAVNEIIALRAEVERLNKSRNKWGQKYNKLLEKHKVTLSQLKTAVWSDSEECKFLTAEVERLREILRAIRSFPNLAEYYGTILCQDIDAALGDTHE